MNKKMLKVTNDKLAVKKGAAFLPMILMVGAVVMMIGMAGLAVGVAFNRSNASIRASNMALEAARSGIADAQRRILLDPKGTSFPSCPSLRNPPSYSLVVSGEASVDVCVHKTGNQYVVQAKGNARLREKVLRAVITIDSATNQMRTQSIDEIQF